MPYAWPLLVAIALNMLPFASIMLVSAGFLASPTKVFEIELHAH